MTGSGRWGAVVPPNGSFHRPLSAGKTVPGARLSHPANFGPRKRRLPDAESPDPWTPARPDAPCRRAGEGPGRAIDSLISGRVPLDLVRQSENQVRAMFRADVATWPADLVARLEALAPAARTETAAVLSVLDSGIQDRLTQLSDAFGAEPAVRTAERRAVVRPSTSVEQARQRLLELKSRRLALAARCVDWPPPADAPSDALVPAKAVRRASLRPRARSGTGSRRSPTDSWGRSPRPPIRSSQNAD